MRYRCPVCMFDRLPYPAADYHICPCCGTEFGSDDARFSHSQLRDMWLASGAFWFFGKAPLGWNPWTQLINGGFGSSVTWFRFGVQVQTDPIAGDVSLTYTNPPLDLAVSFA
jgi:hypothetical protein